MQDTGGLGAFLKLFPGGMKALFIKEKEVDFAVKT